MKFPLFHTMQELAAIPRSQLETEAQALTQVSYIGESTLFCRVLGKYFCYLDSNTLDSTPRLAFDGFWETWVTQAIARCIQPGWKCIDVGANQGYYTLLMADGVGADGRVLAVEPNQDYANLIERSLCANGFDHVEVAAIAASDSNKPLKLSIPDDYAGRASVVRETRDSINVQGLALDSLTQEWNRVDLIKIDAEGAEPLIWRGMKWILNDNPALTIFMEWLPQNHEEPEKLLEAIAEAGFPLRYVGVDSQIYPIKKEELLELDRHWIMLYLNRG